MKAALVRWVFALSLIAANLPAGEEAKESQPKVSITPVAPETFDDPEAGFSMQIPIGFTRLSDADNREVFRGISEHFGKQVGDRTLRRPPVWFKGPTDPKQPKVAPPSLAIGYTDLAENIDVNAKQKYKESLEQAYKKAGIRNGEISIEIVKISEVDSLRIEHDIFSPIDNAHARIVNLAVPGNGRRFDIVFNYSGEQRDVVDDAVKTVIRSFKLKEAPAMDSASQSKWLRVAGFTIGGFVFGVLLMMLLKVLSGAGEKEPEQTGV